MYSDPNLNNPFKLSNAKITITRAKKNFFFHFLGQKIVDVVLLDQLIENAKEMENVNANLIFEETNAMNVKKVSMGIQSAKV